MSRICFGTYDAGEERHGASSGGSDGMKETIVPTLVDIYGRTCFNLWASDKLKGMTACRPDGGKTVNVQQRASAALPSWDSSRDEAFSKAFSIE